MYIFYLCFCLHCELGGFARDRSSQLLHNSLGIVIVNVVPFPSSLPTAISP
jgi:hypothetical protein